MEFETFEQILNDYVFFEPQISLLEKIVESPQRFIGVFRSSTPKLKLTQNFLQSREIRFGDAMEEIITRLLSEKGFINFDKKIVKTANEKALAFDQYFQSSDNTKVYLVEQKIRDDHDSSKTEGQLANFKKKLIFLQNKHPQNLVGILHFIDPAATKNKNYYKQELEKISKELKIPLYLHYGEEFFQYLQDTTSWTFLLESLTRWRRGLTKEIQLDYDADAQASFEKVRNIPPGIWIKLLTDARLWESGLLKIIFPTGEVLRLLIQSYREHGSTVVQIGRKKQSYQSIALSLENELKKYYF